MRFNIAVLALLCGLLSPNAHARFEQFNGPVGYMNVFEVSFGGVPEAYLWGSSWGVADLQAITEDDRTFILKPNINQYEFAAGDGATSNDVVYWTNSDDGGVTPGPDGNKWMDANCFFEMAPIENKYTYASFGFTVDAYDLDPRYTATAFVKILDPGNEYMIIFQDAVILTNTGTYEVSVPMSFNEINMILQAGWSMTGLNANPADDWGSVTVTATSLIAADDDSDAPDPDPMTFAVAPYTLSDSAIGMTASTATDQNGVEYYFTCTAGGGHDSGWQSSTNYVDSGLLANTEYTYTVKARDLSAQTNVTAESVAASATTSAADSTPPSPDPMTFAATDASPVSIRLTATTATDESGVEYYFACVDGDGHDSGWQGSPVYVDSGLLSNSNYTYTVTARDLSSSSNMTAASTPVMVTTTPLPGSYSLTSSLQGFTGDSTQQITIHELAKAGFEFASNEAEKIVGFNTSGATFGDTPTWGSRNILRTLGQDYGDADFEVYATLITQNTAEQAGFVGVGQGIIGNWGVPDFELLGVNAAVAEVQGNWCKVFTFTNGVQEQLVESDGITSSTNRVRMVHDASAGTIMVELDTDYDGSFVADRILGTNSTSNLWEDMPQRIYLAGGAGVLWKDLEIITESAPVIGVEDLSIYMLSEGGASLFWTSVQGQTYDVVYKASLNAESWITDPSPGCSEIPGTGGIISVTSLVDDDQVFYSVFTE